jgi:hypothetical protein
MNLGDTGAILVGRDRPKIVSRGLARIQARSPAPVDILHGRQWNDPALSDYAWVVGIESVTRPPKSTDRAAALAADTWAVEVRGNKPVRVSIRAGSERAQLYALYHLADCLATGKPSAEWAVERRPRVPKRYGWPSAGNVSSPIFRPDQYKQVMEEMPALGINGVLITCTSTHGTHYGRDTIPFNLTGDGVAVDRHKLPVFHALCEELKSYGLDILLMHQAFTPPGFSAEDVRAHYNGTRELPGFETAAEQASYAMADAIFTHLPQVDGLLFHSLECEWMWGNAVSIFPCKDDRAAGGAFEAYLRGIGRACKTHRKDPMYWTHVSGVSARQIRLQHERLAKFPDVLVVEDHAWPNNMWPFAPVMGHIAPDLQAEVVQGRFGLSIDTVDGEYYGAGALPTAYPDPHIRCGKAAADLGAELSFVRMNEQALTPLGTLDDINAIHVIATVEQWWANPRATDGLWKEWCVRRFGAVAAPAVESILKKSRTIIVKGFSAGGVPLLDHSTLLVGGWQPARLYRAWDVFARPGEALVSDKPWNELSCDEIRCRQVSAHGVELEHYLRDSGEAMAAAREALREIEAIRNVLAPKDYAYLTSCFADAILTMEAVRVTASAARASALCMQNRTEKTLHALEDACRAMETCADRIEAERGIDFRRTHWFIKTRWKGREYMGGGVPIALRVIAATYRECAQ